MAPKKEGKKGGKQLVALAQLNAVQTTYKAACRSNGVPLHKGLVSQIEDAILEGSSIDKVSFTGPDVGPGTVKAALEVMAGYPAVKNMACSGCSIGSEGLEAIASYVRASGDKWWKGSRLRLLEVVADGAGTTLESWPATCMAHMSGGLAVQGSGHAQPSFLLDQSAPTITPTSLQLQHVGIPQPTVLQLEEEWSAAAAIAAPITTTMYRALREAKDQQQLEEQLKAAAGVIKVPPAAGYMTRPNAPGTQTAEPNPIDDMTARMTRLASLARVKPPAAEPPDAQRSSGAGEGEALGDIAEDTVLSVQPTQPNQPPNQKPPLLAPVGCTSLRAPPEVLNTPATSSNNFRVRPSYGQAAAGSNFLNGTDNPLNHLRPMTFSPEALHSFSLALGATGHGLQILVLDHNQLGDMGMHKLASGLKRCSKLTHLSLSNCGLGPAAAPALASVLIKDPNALIASQQPQLLLLNLSRNPLGGQGLTTLCEGFAACTTLRVVSMSSCGIVEEDVPALTAFADALAANPSIDNIDLDGNFFGDAGCVAFFPLLSSTKHIKKFRITARGMTRVGGGQLTALVRENLPKKGKKRSASPKKKK